MVSAIYSQITQQKNNDNYNIEIEKEILKQTR